MILFQVVWCCKMNRCGLITTGIFAAITGVLCIVAGAVLLTLDENFYCDPYYYDYYYGEYYDESSCSMTVTGFAIVSFCGAALWIACAVCVFVFACGERIKKYENNGGASSPPGRTSGGHHRPTSRPVQVEPDIEMSPPTQTPYVPKKEWEPTIAVVTPMVPATAPTRNPPPEVGESSSTISYLPDGTKRIDVETIHPDGSKTVTTSFEREGEDEAF